MALVAELRSQLSGFDNSGLTQIADLNTRAGSKVGSAHPTCIGQRQVLLDSLPQLQMPTLVVWGSDDLVFPKEQGQDAVSRLQQGHLALIPDCGHLPHIERPERFTDELSKFLAGVAF
ncbi:MAG TPA: alpha/beta hydrolase [Oculatellaceae cyanobacterium]